jgi:hypothetical protein
MDVEISQRAATQRMAVFYRHDGRYLAEVTHPPLIQPKPGGDVGDRTANG